MVKRVLPPRSPTRKVKAYHYEMRSHIEQAVAKYLELSGRTIEQSPKVLTPCMDDHRFQLKRFVVNGHFSVVVARIVSKAFFTARIARHTMDCKPAGA